MGGGQDDWKIIFEQWGKRRIEIRKIKRSKLERKFQSTISIVIIVLRTNVCLCPTMEA